MRCRCVPDPPAHRCPQKPQTPRCSARQPTLSALAYLPSASPLRPHSLPPASSALQSEGGCFVRAQVAGQYFAGSAEVLGGRPSKGRERRPARPSFPYVRGQLFTKARLEGVAARVLPPVARPRRRSPRLHDRPLLRLRSRPLPAGSPGRVPTRPPARPPASSPPLPTPGRRRRLPARPRRECPCPSGAGYVPGAQGHRRRGGRARPPRTPRPCGGGPGSGLHAYRASRGSGAGRRRGDHGRGRTQGSHAPAAAAGQPRPARSAPGCSTATRSLGRRFGRARPARGGGARAAPARARLLLPDPGLRGGGGRSAWRLRGLAGSVPATLTGTASRSGLLGVAEPGGARSDLVCRWTRGRSL